MTKWEGEEEDKEEEEEGGKGGPGDGRGDLEQGVHPPVTLISIVITVNSYNCTF